MGVFSQEVSPEITENRDKKVTLSPFFAVFLILQLPFLSRILLKKKVQYQSYQQSSKCILQSVVIQM